MAKRRIEDYSGIDKIPAPRDKNKDCWSSAEKRGLQLFKTLDGRQWFALRYTRPDGSGQRTQIFLKATTLAEAYAETDEIKALLAAGKDPVVQRQMNRRRAIQRAAMVGSLTVSAEYRFGSLAPQWLEDLESRGRSSETMRSYRSSMNKYLIPQYGAMDVRLMSWPDAELFITRIAKENRTTAAAAKALAALRAFFSHLLELDLIQANPFVGRKTMTQKLKVEPRKRILTDPEIHQFLNELDEQPIPRQVQIILRAQLMLPLRVGEIASFEWKDFNFEQGFVKHTVKGSGNRKTASSPLPLRLMELFLEWEQESGGKGRLFDKTWSTTRIGKVVRDKLRPWIDFTTHDLRRTASSHLQRMGTPEEIRRAIRNQTKVQGASSKHYDHDDLLAMQNDWLERWHDRLDALRDDPGAFKTLSEAEKKRAALLRRYNR